MSSPGRKVRRAAQAAKVTARSVQSSGIIKCYVERFEHIDGTPDLRLREKLTLRTVRVLTDDQMLYSLAPLSNLLRDCYGHGGGLIEPRNRSEHVAIAAPIFTQNSQDIAVLLNSKLSVAVKALPSRMTRPPHSVWCYVEEYEGGDGSRGLRLRQKITGRKIEMYGENKRQLTNFLASTLYPRASELMPNLYEKNGYRDYVMVSGGVAVDSYDVLLFNDGAELTYLLGPTPDTAYRDAFRILEEESAAAAHSRTAAEHFGRGLYREAILSARLAVEMASGGRPADVKRRLAEAPKVVLLAGDALYAQRHVAVHEGGTRVEQQDALESIRAMNSVLEFLMQDSCNS